jgi:hypothetical protein
MDKSTTRKRLKFPAHDPEKACPALDAGAKRLFETIMRKQ